MSRNTTRPGVIRWTITPDRLSVVSAEVVSLVDRQTGYRLFNRQLFGFMTVPVGDVWKTEAEALAALADRLETAAGELRARLSHLANCPIGTAPPLSP